MPKGMPKNGINKGWFKKGRKPSKEELEKRSKAMAGNTHGFQKGHTIWKGEKRLDISGEKCHLWKGGITPENEKERRTIEYKLWRKSIWGRDNFTCQKCGQYGGYLVAHHINNFSDFVELRTAIDNGITLCKQCHLDFHNKYGRKNNTKEQLKEFIKNASWQLNSWK